jgi:hypothetical protein
MAIPVPVNASSLEGAEVADFVAGPVPLPPPFEAVVGEPPWLPPVLGFTVVTVKLVEDELEELELEELELDELEEELLEEELDELEVVVPPQPGTTALNPEYQTPARATSTWKEQPEMAGTATISSPEVPESLPSSFWSWGLTAQSESSHTRLGGLPALIVKVAFVLVRVGSVGEADATSANRPMAISATPTRTSSLAPCLKRRPRPNGATARPK